MSTPRALALSVPELTLTADAAAALKQAQDEAPEPQCTPDADVAALRKRLAGGERRPWALLRAESAAPTPGDAALVGALVRQLLPRADVVVEGDAEVPLDQSVFPPQGQVVVPGSLRVQGELRVVAPLVVCGDLEVDGVITDCGPESVIVVLGDLRCRALCTTGEVLVAGDLEARDFVWGQYNDNTLEVHGTLRTAVLMSDDHAIEAESIEVSHQPPEGGDWGDDTFDMSGEHVEALTELLTDPACVDDEGQLDLERLSALASPWKSA